MATKKDLVEAYQFSRRRLVTAFVSGAPGGREVEPPRPGRTIVGGVALAVLMIAGAAIAGIFAPRDPADWKDVGLVLSKDTGAAYVITEKSDDPLLRPVINITSAKLVLGPGHEPRVVSQDTIEQQRIGDSIGILGAPADLPSTDLLIDEGWTACTGDGTGTKVHVSERPQVSYADGAAFVVRNQGTGEHHLVAEAAPDRSGDDPSAHSYRLPRGAEGSPDNLLSALGLPPTTDAVPVSEDWLALFPTGGALTFDSFQLSSVGDPIRGGGAPDGARVGDLLTGERASYLLTADGPVELDDFALAVYQETDPRGASQHSGEPQGGHAASTYDGARWPESRLREANGEICAQLQPREGETPLVRLAENPTGEASAEGVGDDARAQKVDAGRGAHVLSGSWDGSGTGSPFVIDSKAVAHALVGDGAGDLLGYGDHAVRVVPDSWVSLFREGVDLSQDAALQEPTQQPGTGDGG